MHNQCDVMILTARFGQGHISVAQAIKAYIEESTPELNVQIADFYEIINPFFYKSMYKGYELLIKNGHKIYNMYYYRKNENDALKKMDNISKSNMKRLHDKLKIAKPKMVISVFPVCAAYISEYKRLYDIDLKTATCITDIVDNNEWLHDNTDTFFVATKEIKEALMVKGISKEAISVTGIPVKSNFLNLKPDKNIRLKYGFKQEDRIILMMGGGLGLLPEDEKFYNKLRQTVAHVKIVVLTGNNKSLYHRLKRMRLANVDVLKYTDKVADYMQLADIFIGKVGGITLFESIACQIPLVAYKPILGQEVGNCEFIEENGIGYVTHTEEDLIECVETLFKSRDSRRFIQQRLSQLKQNMNMEHLIETVADCCNIRKEKQLGIVG